MHRNKRPFLCHEGHPHDHEGAGGHPHTHNHQNTKLVLNRHTLLRTFLEKLGVSRRTADKDACLMEHILSAETIDRIRTYTETESTIK